MKRVFVYFFLLIVFYFSESSIVAMEKLKSEITFFTSVTPETQSVFRITDQVKRTGVRDKVTKVVWKFLGENLNIKAIREAKKKESDAVKDAEAEVKKNEEDAKEEDKKRGMQFLLVKPRGINVLKLSKIKKIDEGLVQLADSVKEIEIRGGFSDLPSDLSQLKNLTTLRLDGLTSKQIPEVVFKCTNLEELYIDNSKIETVPVGIGQLKKLKVLSISNDTDSDELEKLKYDYRKANKNRGGLKKLPEEVGELKNLERFVIWHNSLTKLPDSFGNLKKLKSCNLSSNKLEEFPEPLLGCTKLTSIDLNYNKIESVPEKISDLSELWSIDISYCSLQSLPESIGFLGELRRIEAGYNELTSLPSNITNLPEIRILHFWHNKITQIPSNIGDLKKLDSLELGDNQLVGIPKSIGKITGLDILGVDRNPTLKTLPEEEIVKIIKNRRSKSLLNLRVHHNSGLTITNRTLRDYILEHTIDSGLYKDKGKSEFYINFTGDAVITTKKPDKKDPGVLDKDHKQREEEKRIERNRLEQERRTKAKKERERKERERLKKEKEARKKRDKFQKATELSGLSNSLIKLKEKLSNLAGELQKLAS